ncbi:MAG: MFS transporter [Clostridiales bacterium]|nr:MFS transporter [Clostridiales bacterium]
METQYPKYRWFVLVVLFIAIFGSGMVLIAPSPMVQSIYVSIFGTPSHGDTAGVFAGQVSLMMMVSFTLFTAISGIVSGQIADRIGVQKTILLGLILIIIGAALFMVAGHNIVLLVISRIVMGFGSGPMVTLQAKVASEWFPERQRSLVIGLGGAALSGGIAVGLNAGQAVYMQTGAQQVFYLQNVATGAIDGANKIFNPGTVNPALLAQNRLVRVIEGGNWNLAIAVMGIVSILSLILVVIWMNGPKPPQVAEPIQAAEGGEHLFAKAVKSAAFPIGILVIFCGSWLLNVINDLTPNHLGDTFIGLGWGPANGGTVLSMFSLAYLVGSIVAGILLMTLFRGKYRLHNTIAFIIGAAVILMVIMPQFVNPNPAQPGMPPAPLIVAMIVAGFFMSMPIVIVQAFVANNYPKQLTGRIGGMSMGIGFLGGTVGVAVSSMTLVATGHYDLSIIIVSIASVIGAILGIWLKRPRAFAEEEAAKIADK